MSRSEIEYLKHIKEEAEYLAKIKASFEKEDFLKDETQKRAAIRSIEIIGEATKQISDDFKTQFQEIEWRPMASMRDRLIHGYFSVDFDIVWDVITNESPKLVKNITKVIRQKEQM